MSDWFENWFDSPHYHSLYSNRDSEEAEAFINMMFKYYGWIAPQRILDLACGSGRYAEVLTKMGHRVTGLDLSKESINIARSRNLSNAEFVVGDMRYFDLLSDFDLVLNLFTSFGYFEDMVDNQTVLNRVFSHLKPRGYLVIDYLNPDYVRNTLVENETKEFQGTVFNITRNLTEHHVIKRIEVMGEEEVHEERVQLIENDEFSRMLEQAGFKIRDVFGSYDLKSYSKQSNRQILIATI